MDPLNNYTTTRGRSKGSNCLPLQVVLIFWERNKYVCHIIYILVLGICYNMAVPSKSLWLFYLFCQLFLKPIKHDKFLLKEIFSLYLLLKVQIVCFLWGGGEV